MLLRDNRKNDEINRNNLAKKRGFKDYNDYQNYKNHKNGICLPMSENKSCSNYLGIVVSERYLSKVWDNVTRMSNNNKGYDFICGKGFKVDVKSGCLCKNNGWSFHIRRNKIADYFLLLGFDNREDLNPLHIWLIKGDVVINGKKLGKRNDFFISQSSESLLYYSKYECKDKLNKLKDYCNKE